MSYAARVRNGGINVKPPSSLSASTPAVATTATPRSEPAPSKKAWAKADQPSVTSVPMTGTSNISIAKTGPGITSGAKTTTPVAQAAKYAPLPQPPVAVSVAASRPAHQDLKEQDDMEEMPEFAKPVADERFQTEDVTATQGHEFEDYFLKRELLQGIFDKGFLHPSPVQEEAIPAMLAGQSVLVRAKNGTGKTGAYAIPILDRINVELKSVQALVLVPTRELALQTSAVIRSLAKHMRIECMMTTGGGNNTREDILRLSAGVHVLVGTPGRILDLTSRNSCNLSNTSMVVLDEADKLLAVDFKPIIESILELSNDGRRLQVGLFSATFPVTVKPFKDKWLPDAVIVNKMNELTLKGIHQFYAYVDEKQKWRCLYMLLSRLEINQSIVFCNTSKRVELLSQKIADMGSTCFHIHSRMTQDERNKVFHEFRSGSVRHLICTDLLTRGIDVQSVNVVINFDLPRASETYLHRIGRSGRFGHYGLAISLVSPADREDLERIEVELGTEMRPIPPSIDRNLYCV